MRPLVQDKLYRKLLTAKRVLVVNLKHLKNELEWNDLDDLATEFQEIKKSFADYKTRVNDNICDPQINYQCDGVVVRASASQPVGLGFKRL